MATPVGPATRAVKVVAAALEGERIRGFIFDFSPLKERCRIFPTERAKADEAHEIDMRKLKAMFFIKEFTEPGGEKANPNEFVGVVHGRKLQVEFSDGELLMGSTEGYAPNRLGFFLFPANSNSNILRAFVINANVKEVKWIK
ncbi:MAG: DUF6982 domain-containing protein [Candidatus Acidiferrales bacterium]